MGPSALPGSPAAKTADAFPEPTPLPGANPSLFPAYSPPSPRVCRQLFLQSNNRAQFSISEGEGKSCGPKMGWKTVRRVDENENAAGSATKMSLSRGGELVEMNRVLPCRHFAVGDQSKRRRLPKKWTRAGEQARSPAPTLSQTRPRQSPGKDSTKTLRRGGLG